jgi:hypothetical protein
MPMAHDLLRTLLLELEVFRGVLTHPGFANLIVVFSGWVRTAGPHAVTQALVVTGVAGRRHHEAFHRFFSRGTWQPDALGKMLFQAVCALVPEGGAVPIAIDDTLAPKKGEHVFGIGSHLDAVRSTRQHRVFCFGHCWVVLAVRVRVPFSTRVWALPVLFRLYRNKKECLAKGHLYRKKTELAREMLEVFLSWVGERRVELAADSAYCNDTVMRGQPAHLVLFGAMRPNAVLTALPTPRRKGRGGRPRVRGALLPKPERLANDKRHEWRTCRATLYGRRQAVQYKECFAQWYRACGIRLLRIVIVKVATGSVGIRVFFCTDPTLSVKMILEGYAGRWSIECAFKNLKQMLGFADSAARKKEAVERTAPFVGLTYTLLIVWFTKHAYLSPLATPPVRPWYRHKQGLAFSDVLRTAQEVLQHCDVLDPSRSFDNLHDTASARPEPASRGQAATNRRASNGET